MWSAIVRGYHWLYGDRGDDNPVSLLVAYWGGTFHVLTHPVAHFGEFWSWFWEFNRLPNATPEHCLGLAIIKVFATVLSLVLYLFFLVLQLGTLIFVYAMIRQYLF
jgi:hypothetical protein